MFANTELTFPDGTIESAHTAPWRNDSREEVIKRMTRPNGGYAN